jgi:hypothetical protein
MSKGPKRSRLVIDLTRTIHEQSPRGMFHHVILQIAQTINRKGVAEQLQFLIDQKGERETINTVERLLKLEESITALMQRAAKDDAINLLLRTVYDLKMKEAHDIAHSKTRNVVRYLVREIGIDRVTKLINSGGNYESTKSDVPTSCNPEGQRLIQEPDGCQIRSADDPHERD